MGKSDRKRRDACDDENMEKNEAGECVCIGETSEDGECMSDRKRRDVCDDENMEKNEAGECVCIGETSEDGECQVKSDRKRRDACDDENMERMKLENVYALVKLLKMGNANKFNFYF